MRWRHAFLTEPPRHGERFWGNRWFEFVVLLIYAVLAKMFFFS